MTLDRPSAKIKSKIEKVKNRDNLVSTINLTPKALNLDIQSIPSGTKRFGTDSENWPIN
jgi:hypothetical protein